MRIVIVEDEDQIRSGLSHLMQHIHPEHQIVGTASDGKLGLELIRQKLPDIVITDVRMPNMDGLEMIRQASQEGIRVKYIIISAFSEFNYAKTAMSYGVTEYLLKPLSITELTGSLKKLELQISTDTMNMSHDSLEDAIIASALRGYTMTNQDFKRISLQHDLSEDARFCLILFCYGSGALPSQEDRTRILRKFQTEAETACHAEMEGHNGLLYVLHCLEPQEETVRWMETAYKVYGSNLWHSPDVMMGFCSGLAGLYEACKGMLEALPWRISFPDRQILHWPQVTKSQTVPCTFPVDLENQLRGALCSRNLRKIGRAFDQFNLYFSGSSIYRPQEIRECYTRFLWAGVKLARELDLIRTDSLTTQRLLETVFSAKSMPQLHGVANSLLAQIGDAVAISDPERGNINIFRAKSLVREFYSSGITLEETAQKLNITPEYLSTQFRQEVGETFSTYLRNFRIAKAKELLLGTELKLQQIAQQVGYTDAKYFSQVFKKTTGMLPGEYRQNHK